MTNADEIFIYLIGWCTLKFRKSNDYITGMFYKNRQSLRTNTHTKWKVQFVYTYNVPMPFAHDMQKMPRKKSHWCLHINTSPKMCCLQLKRTSSMVYKMPQKTKRTHWQKYSWTRSKRSPQIIEYTFQWLIMTTLSKSTLPK